MPESPLKGDEDGSLGFSRFFCSGSIRSFFFLLGRRPRFDGRLCSKQVESGFHSSRSSGAPTAATGAWSYRSRSPGHDVSFLAREKKATEIDTVISSDSTKYFLQKVIQSHFFSRPNQCFVAR